MTAKTSICATPVTIQVPYAPTVTLTCSPTKLISPQTVTCTANVSGGATGSVVFTLNGAAWTTVTLNSSGNATAANGLAGAKTYDVYTVSAAYSGDSVDNAATRSTTVRLNAPVTSWLPAINYLLFTN
jgi:hypothetical protein